MKAQRQLTYELDQSEVSISAAEALWDSKLFGFPVISIVEFQIKTADWDGSAFVGFESWLENHQVGLVSARLGHKKLYESMFLEQHGFRFVEMVLHPYWDRIQSTQYPVDSLSILPATVDDLPAIQIIALTAFGFERFHIDPRLSSKLGDQRYGNWVASALNHPTQKLLKILDEHRLIGFFLIEESSDQSVYWHLTAVSKEFQRMGYGHRVWTAMLKYHQQAGFLSVATTIAARNTPVLNLYSKLQFKFSTPNMTLHLVRTRFTNG